MSRQKGFTLLELLVALAISGVLLTIALSIFFELNLGTGRTSSQLTADLDVNRAAYAIQRDLTMTQTSNLTGGDPTPQSSVLLSWIDYTGFESANQTYHSSSYSSNGTVLWRTYNGNPEIVGRNITYLGFTQDGRVINVVVTSKGMKTPERSQTLEFSVLLRAEGIE